MFIYKGGKERRYMIKITKEYLNQLDEKMDMIPLSYDLVFKSIFKLNLNLLVDFLNASLKIEIAKDEKIRILDSELPVTNKNERKKMIDIIVSINDKIFIDIEMNRSKFEYVMERNFNYLDKIATIIFEKGKSIKDINNIQLNLNISPFEEDLEDIIVPYGLLTQKIYPSNKRLIIKSLALYSKLYYNEGVKTKEIIWYMMLIARTFSELYELSKQILDEKEVNKLMEAMIEMSNDEFILHEWQKDKMDALVKQNEMEGAKQEGIEQGIMENKIEIAKNMLKENMDIQTISRLTTLTETDIQKLKNTMN